MSWIEKTQSDFIITTGDGREFKPKWLNATKGKTYNLAEFDFPNLAGTLVNRTTPRGRRYEIEIYFQGENHLDDASTFETSADDPRAWTISHPLYGSLIVQPAGLNFDNTVYNVSKITGTVIETITEDNPKTSIDPKDKITTDKEATDQIMAQSFANDVQPETTEINSLLAKNETLYNEGKKGIKLNIEAEEYFNRFKAANSAILRATSKPLEAMRKLQAVINYPGQFVDGVRNRIKTLLNQFGLLRASVTGIVSRFEKKTYESAAGTLISSMALSSATPQNGDYGNRPEVLAVMDELLTTFETYLADLDDMQTENGGSTDSYIPDADSIIALNALVNFTVTNLFNIALNSKQERSVIIEDDTNLILLAHRFYGLLPDDSTIDELIKNNNIGLNRLLDIRKGTRIVYYV